MKKSILLVMIGILLLGGIDVNGITTMKASNENHTPNAPTIDGPTTVKTGIESHWSFNSSDSDGDDITYYVDWGDVCGGAEWHGPFPSGDKVEIMHTYTIKNTLIINSMAVDENGAESNMSYFEVTISKSSSINLIFIHLLERYPTHFRFSNVSWF
jgi:hypothetical protein